MGGVCSIHCRMRHAYNLGGGNSEGKRKILKSTPGDKVVKTGSQGNRCGGLDLTGSGYRQMVSFCENDNEYSGSTKYGNFLD